MRDEHAKAKRTLRGDVFLRFIRFSFVCVTVDLLRCSIVFGVFLHFGIELDKNGFPVAPNCALSFVQKNIKIRENEKKKKNREAKRLARNITTGVMGMILLCLM